MWNWIERKPATKTTSRKTLSEAEKRRRARQREINDVHAFREQQWTRRGGKFARGEGGEEILKQRHKEVEAVVAEYKKARARR